MRGSLFCFDFVLGELYINKMYQIMLNLWNFGIKFKSWFMTYHKRILRFELEAFDNVLKAWLKALLGIFHAQFLKSEEVSHKFRNLKFLINILWTTQFATEFQIFWSFILKVNRFTLKWYMKNISLLLIKYFPKFM